MNTSVEGCSSINTSKHIITCCHGFVQASMYVYIQNSSIKQAWEWHQIPTKKFRIVTEGKKNRTREA